MIDITYELAHAAGTDAANRQMRKAGRTAWSEDDYNLACRTMNELFPMAGMLLGSIKSERKAEASRANGAKSPGWPKGKARKPKLYNTTLNGKPARVTIPDAEPEAEK